MLVFCANEEHATALRRELMAANTDLVRRYPEYVARIMSVDGEEGKRLLEAMQDGADAPVIAVTTRLLSTGVDIPDVRTRGVVPSRRIDGGVQADHRPGHSA